MQHFRIRNGDWPTTRSGPGPETPERCPVSPVSSVAFLGADFPGLRPRFEVKEGDRVQPGQVLFRDRKHPQIVTLSPLAGRVASLAYGPRRSLSSCVLVTDGAAPDACSDLRPDTARAATPRDRLLASGLWPAIRSRPFGHVPTPDETPAAIFVNAVHAIPQAPDPRRVVQGSADAFGHGVAALQALTKGTVFVCQSPGAPLLSPTGRTICAAFSGSAAAGLAGTHIDRLCPVGPRRRVWSIGYQDVIAIGQLLLTGQYAPDRVMTVTGTATGTVTGTATGAAQTPRVIRALPGACMADLCGTGDGFAGRFADVVAPPHSPARAAAGGWLRWLFPATGGIVPTRAMDRALAVNVAAVPLARALCIGDVETAARLGCHALVEEDVASLTRNCTSGTEYGPLLRDTLTALMAEAT